MNELDANLERLIRAAELPEARVDAACRGFLTKLAPPRRSSWIAPLAAALLLFAFVLGFVLLPGGDATPARQEDALKALIAKLGHETPEARDQATRELRARGRDLEYAVDALERRQGSRRIARELRALVGAELSHDGPLDEVIVDEIRRAPILPVDVVLEMYDVSDLTENGTISGEELVDGVKNLKLEEWQGRSSIEYNGELLIIRAKPEVQTLVRAYLRELRAPAVARAPRKDVDDRLGTDEIGRGFLEARAALEKAAAAGDAELATRARQLLREFKGAIERLRRHGPYRRAVAERIAAEEASVEPAGLPALIRRSFEPCEVEEPRILRAEDVPAGLLRTLQAPAAGAVSRGQTLYFLLPSRGLVAEVRFLR